ncbi:MAG: hypothetical protein ACRC6V_00890 [Bacteroidales bacterium]
MGLFFFYNQRKPRQFNHKPIYYDQRKEELEKRIQRVKREMGEEIKDEEFKPDLKGAFADQTHHVRRRRENPDKGSSATNIRLFIILVILAILAYFLYFKG